MTSDLLADSVLTRKAVIYVRQSTPQQVVNNVESQRRQYQLVASARSRGFREVEVIDDDQVKLGFGHFRRFREPGVEFSTVCPHPDGRPCKRKRSGRKGATGSLIRSLPGGPARDAARPGVSRRCPPSGPPTCAGRAAERSR